jgi:uncharacterized protein YciI
MVQVNHCGAAVSQFPSVPAGKTAERLGAGVAYSAAHPQGAAVHDAFIRRSIAAAAVVAACAAQGALAQAQTATATPNEPTLFAVEITVGSTWDPSKPPQAQPFFQDHSANLKRLRDSGALVMGARYSDKGLVVLAAPSEAIARAMMDEDPSIQAGVFKYQIHAFSVFYGGTVYPRPRKAAP